MALDEEVIVLKTYVLNKPAEEASRDPVTKRVLRDSMRVAVESMLDVCKHIVSSSSLGVVREYRDYPAKLHERALMPKDLSDQRIDYVKLRNIIVHRYAEVDFTLLRAKALEAVNSTPPAFREHVIRLA